MSTVYQPIVDETMDKFLNSLGGVETDEDGYFQAVPPLRNFFISIALRILLGKSSNVPHGLAEDLSIWSAGLLAPPLTFLPWSTAAKALRARKRIMNTMKPLLEAVRSEK